MVRMAGSHLVVQLSLLLRMFALLVSLSVRGGLNIFVHTASRYDECQLLTLPLVDIDVGYQFICEGDSPSHHSVTRCFNSKLPLSAEGQVGCTLILLYGLICFTVIVLLLGT